jgi:hypothetical protein
MEDEEGINAKLDVSGELTYQYLPVPPPTNKKASDSIKD